MSKIFESPDGGKTVYVREFGKPDRCVVKYNEDRLIREEELEFLHAIRESRKGNNLALADAVQQVLTIFRLVQKHE